MKKIAVSALFFSLVGCGSLFHSSAPPPTTYQLAVDEKPAGAPLPADLAVLAPRVRRGLDNDRLAIQYPDRRLDYLAAARWSGPLDEMLQDLTLEAFWQAGVLHTVDTDTSAFASGYWLEIIVADFQAEYKDNHADAAPVVHVHFVARVGRAQDRHLLGEFDAEARQPAADNRLTAVVAAYNQATDATLARVVAETTDIVRRNPETH